MSTGTTSSTNTIPYMELAKLCQQSYDTRRSYEWKVMFGLWTGIGVFTWFVVQNNTVISGSTTTWIGIGYVCAFIVWLFSWPSLHVSNAFDVTCRKYYQRKAEGLSSGKNPLEEDKEYRKTLIAYWSHQAKKYREMFARNLIMWAQIVFTFEFLLLSFILMQNADKAGSSDPDPRYSDTVIERLSSDSLQHIIEKIPAPD
ncbi:MAG: hypothetical protein IH831_07605 [Planctomycetes bacterium]|nr:hypothetical protein [Planctomycetota bacterium]